MENEMKVLDTVIKQMMDERREPLCVCLQYVGDNGDCPVHPEETGTPHGNCPQFGSAAWFAGVEPEPF